MDVSGLLPFLSSTPFLLALVVFVRLWLSAVKELREERADHRRTQQELDAERDSRRQVEDKVDALSREVHALKDEIGRLRKQLDEVTT